MLQALLWVQENFLKIFSKMDVISHLPEGTSFVSHIFVLLYSQVHDIDYTYAFAIASFCFYINIVAIGKKVKI